MIAWVALQAPPRDFAHIQTLEPEAGQRADAAAACDLDGDGKREVLLAVHAPGKDWTRGLEVWRPQASGELARAETIALTADVVAFACADVRAGGGEELVLFNAGGAFVWSFAPEARPERLLACEFLWQTADPESVFAWSAGVRDLDGDGLADLCLPEAQGFALALQRRARPGEAGDGARPWGRVSRVRVPVDAGDAGVWSSPEPEHGAVESQRDNGSFSLGFRVSDGDGPLRSALVSLGERVPAPFWLDWDADADLDLLLQTKRHLHVWLQGEDGGFTEAPQHSLELPVLADDAREMDASYSAHAVDLDLDRRADCVIFAGDKRSDEVRAQALFFTQAAVQAGPPLFGQDGRPANLLVFAGFVSAPTFCDLDGDGYPELVVRTLRPDLIDQIRSASSESIDADLYVYRNRRGVLARKPELARSHAVPLEDFALCAEFLGDLTGDGLSELFVRDEPETLRILRLAAQGARDKSVWSLSEAALWELNVAREAQVELVPAAAGARASLFVLEPAQVLWVRFD